MHFLLWFVRRSTGNNEVPFSNLQHFERFLESLEGFRKAATLNKMILRHPFLFARCCLLWASRSTIANRYCPFYIACLCSFCVYLRAFVSVGSCLFVISLNVLVSQQWGGRLWLHCPKSPTGHHEECTPLLHLEKKIWNKKKILLTKKMSHTGHHQECTPLLHVEKKNQKEILVTCERNIFIEFAELLFRLQLSGHLQLCHWPSDKWLVLYKNGRISEEGQLALILFNVQPDLI